MEQSKSDNQGSRVLSVEQMTALDRACIKNGTPSLELMERAGVAIVKALEQMGAPLFRPVILCGKGNNGGDGLVVARLLKEKSLNPLVVLSGASGLSAESSENLDRALSARVEVYLFKGSQGELNLPTVNENQLLDLFNRDQLVIDALLGSGQRSAPKGSIAEILNILEKAQYLYGVAIDVPTGTDANTGELFEPGFKARKTLCIQNLKRGLLQYPARSVCGDILTLDIGIPGAEVSQWQKIESSNLPVIEPRKPDSHKNTFGHVVVIGGSRATPGAPVLSASAALETGAGLVSLCSWSDSPVVTPPSLMHLPVELTQSGVISLESLSLLEESLAKATVFAVGPGLGKNLEVFDYVISFAKKQSIPVVIDADGLNLITQSKVSLSNYSTAIYTPHPGEAAQILGMTSKEVQADRYTAIEALQSKLGGVVVLKGANPLVRSADSGFVFDQAEPVLATAGSGDVLTGIISGLLAQRIAPLESSILGVAIQLRMAQNARLRSRVVLPAEQQVRSLSKSLSRFY